MGRCLSKEHIEAYQQGIFQKLLMAVKEDPELSLEIRKDNEAIIYYKKDKLLTTSYTSAKQFKVKLLDAQYYKNESHPAIDLMKEEKALKSLTIIRKYFKEAKRLVHVYKVGAEFAAQQSIALGNHSYDNQYLIVDMEWQLPQEDIPVDKRISKTRIDLVIVDTIPNEHRKNDIYLAELKVGMGAVEGDSGIKDHVKKTQEIINFPLACAALKSDVQHIIEQKEALGLIEGEHKDLVLEDVPKMMIIAYSRGGEETKKLKEACLKALDYSFINYGARPLLIEIDGRITL